MFYFFSNIQNILNNDDIEKLNFEIRSQIFLFANFEELTNCFITYDLIRKNCLIQNPQKR